MSAHVEVVSTDFRRAKVKVLPGTYLVDVLNEACKKLNLNGDRYLLKHKQKVVDLTVPYRASGLTSGAKLELIQKSSSPSVISIGLDVDGKRFTKKLASDMSLWQVLRQFETAEKDLNLTGRASPKSSDGGQLYFDSPVINIMGKTFEGVSDLAKTLSQCGINAGSIRLVVTFQATDKTLSEALGEIDQYLVDVDPSQPKTTKEKPAKEAIPEAAPPQQQQEPIAPEPTAPETTQEPKPEDTPQPQVQQDTAGPQTSEPMDLDQPLTSPLVDGVLQPVEVFAAPTSSTPAAAQVHVDETVYEPTIAHAQLRQKQLLAKAQNKRLKSDAELAAAAAEDAARLDKITTLDVRVRFPDGTSSKWTLGPANSAADLYAAVRGIMARPELPFQLVMPATRTHLEDSAAKLLLRHYRFTGRELLNLLFEESVSVKDRQAAFLKEEAARRAHQLPVPDVPQSGPDEAVESHAESSSKPTGSGKSESSKMPDMKKLSKFFKLPGKK
ncbi:GLUT4 regulating protein TUG-domain-containing protein [Podospora conica]|nr:GLUT4 regulating protein TUG-domain-containing protein [Schizothecium conicum]